MLDYLHSSNNGQRLLHKLVNFTCHLWSDRIQWIFQIILMDTGRAVKRRKPIQLLRTSYVWLAPSKAILVALDTEIFGNFVRGSDIRIPVYNNQKNRYGQNKAKNKMAAQAGFLLFKDKISQPLVALNRCLLNSCSFTWKIHRGECQLAV